ncbi:hypothetical protein ACP70R_039416 [Stipagrostis hirtigluma subsp. patula]
MRGGGGRGGGGGGGRQQPYAGADGADAAAIPAASRKMVQSLKGILADRSEAEIYATLCDCSMDPDVAVERLISQDTFHEVRRKRDKKKETKASQETRSRPFHKSMYRGYKGSSDRSGRFQAGLGADSMGSVKGPTKKEAELHAPANSSVLDTVKTSNPTDTTGNTALNESPIASNTQADAKYNTFQPPSQVQHGWVSVPGRPSMADIVKMGRPQAKVGGRSVASSTGVPAVVDSTVISNAPSQISKESNSTVSPPEVGHDAADKLSNGATEAHSLSKDVPAVNILPTGEGLGMAESLSTPDGNEDGTEEDTNLVENKDTSGIAENLSISEQYGVSGKEIDSQNAAIPNHLDNGSIGKTDDFQSNGLQFGYNQNSDEDMSATMKQFDHLTLHEEKGPKSSDDNPAVIIPDHLQVSNADCAHLTFGSFVSGTLDAPLSIKPLNSEPEVAAVSDNHSIDHTDVRIHEDENKATVTPAANEYVASATNNSIENLDVTSVQQSEATRADFMDVANNTEYNLSSTSDYATSSAVQPDSASRAYLQENRQLQNISPLSSFMQGNMPNGLLPPTMAPLREFDPAFSLLLTNPPLASMMHGTTASSMSNATGATQPQENVNQSGGLPNPQLTQSQPSTSIASGPPLPQHLALHHYAHATLPLGYASMIGYPSLPQSYAYIPPAAFQQPYMNSSLFHQAAAAVPNSGVKYPLPQYKSNIPLASLPQPASMLSSYVGGFGTANNMPGNFALNQSTASATTTIGFDGTVPSQYKDGNQFNSLQQSDNAAMWMHGAGSRAMPPLAANTMYGYQGQSHQGGLWQGLLPLQFGAVLGQSQPGLGPEHRNPSDSNLNAAAQANPMWPNSY